MIIVHKSKLDDDYCLFETNDFFNSAIWLTGNSSGKNANEEELKSAKQDYIDVNKHGISIGNSGMPWDNNKIANPGEMTNVPA